MSPAQAHVCADPRNGIAASPGAQRLDLLVGDARAAG